MLPQPVLMEAGTETGARPGDEDHHDQFWSSGWCRPPDIRGCRGYTRPIRAQEIHCQPIRDAINALQLDKLGLTLDEKKA